MPDFRVFCRPASPEAPELTLSPEESHHLIVVNRARRGDPVIAFDGLGTEWTTIIASDRRNGAVLQVRRVDRRPPLPHRISLAQALPKGASMDAIVRKATEIGAAAVIPLETERTQVHLGGERSDRKVEKWQTAALEAAKQCGNPFLPDIRPITRLDAFLREPGDFDLRLIASLHPGARSLKAVFTSLEYQPPARPSVVWLIGPEGDFSPSEVEQALAAGFAPVTLGPLVLRCETAATYALSITSYELQAQPVGTKG